MNENPYVQIDAADRRILQSLRDLPRATASERADYASMTRTTYRSRLQQLWSSGVIIAHEPQLDLALLGFTVQASVDLEVVQGRLDEVQELLADNPNVIEAYSTTGRSDVRCRLAGLTTTHLQEILLEIGESPHVFRTESVVILDSLVAARKVQTLDTLHLE